MHHAHVGIYQFVKFGLLHIRDFVIRDIIRSGATLGDYHIHTNANSKEEFDEKQD